MTGGHWKVPLTTSVGVITALGNIASISCRWPNTEEMGRLKLIETQGAIDLLAGDDLTLANLGNMSQTTEGDLV